MPERIENRNIIAERDYAWLHERIGDPERLELTLDEAIDFALDHSLLLRVQQAELRLADDAIFREMILMLPNLEISGLVSHRSNRIESISQSVEPQLANFPPSFGSLQTTSLWNVELAWNILNTGIQFFRTKEAKNAAWARNFVYQRTVQDLIRDVVSAYWLVAVMQASAEDADELTVISRDLAKKLRSQVDKGNISLERATDLIGRIYYQQVQAKNLLRNYRGAIDQFKALLGIPPCVEVIVKVPKEKILPGALPQPCELHQVALNYRPDLYQIDAELALHEDEIREALLNLFPALTPFIRYTLDTNPFLVNNYWTSVGFSVLYDLLSIPLSISSQQTAEDRVRVSQAQRLYLSLTILSQIHIVYAQYQDSLDRFKDARIYWEAKRNSFNLAEAKKKLDAIGDLEYVFPLADLLFAETQMNLFYVEVMGNLEQLSNTIGIPRYFTEKYGLKPEPSILEETGLVEEELLEYSEEEEEQTLEDSEPCI